MSTPVSMTNRMGGLVVLLATNTHIPLLAQVARVALATYRVRAVFTRQHTSQGDTIWVGGRVLLRRPKKHGAIQPSENVTVLAHTFSQHHGGSNKYPCLTYAVGATCELEFTSEGLPELDGHGWAMHITHLEKLHDYQA